MTFGQLKGSKLIKYILHISCSLTTFQAFPAGSSDTQYRHNTQKEIALSFGGGAVSGNQPVSSCLHKGIDGQSSRSLYRDMFQFTAIVASA